jgi:PKD repeat protein
VQPVWVNEAGGDTMWGVAITDTAVFVGGHARWNNNPNGSDFAGPGAVPRPGLAALDPISGRPLSWNPGRNPEGKAVYAVTATSEGVYIGSDTDWIGNRKYKRQKVAFFPYTGGTPVASTTTGTLPGTVYRGGGQAGGTTNVLYRVNAGGFAIQALDNGPDWADDSGGSSIYRNDGSNAAGWSPVPAVDATVPATTPSTVFDSERWSPSDNPPMKWAFPVASGTPLQVRLYFANRCTCTSGVGSRVFNVNIDGQRVLNNYDIVAAVGDQTGTMRSFSVTSDGSVNIDFSHVTENPLINGIEIVRTDVTPSPTGADSLSKVDVTTTSAGSPQTVDNGSIPWGSTRGAFMVGNTVYYGKTDSFLYRRSFNGTTFGAEQQINAYHDPLWKDVDNNLGGTYDGASPTLYSQMPNVTGMTFWGGKLYYTLFGDATMHARWFSPDSGIVDERTFNVPSSVNFSDANGMFVAGSRLYYVSKSNGNLNSVDWNGSVTGSPSVISGPGVDGNNWSNRSLFLYNGPRPNQAPTAAFTSSCTNATCSFDGSGSTDSDGSVASYAWKFGDGSTGTGATPSHTYAAAGTYTVQLTVTDNQGATNAVSNPVTVTASAQQISFVGAAHSAGGSTKAKSVVVPASTQAGDTLVVTLTQPNTKPFADPTGTTGLTQAGTVTNVSVLSTVWKKQAVASDAGATISVASAVFSKALLTVSVYRGADAASLTTTSSIDSATANHVSPTVTVGAGHWVMTYWVDKSSTTTSFTAPSSVTTRDTTTDTGTGSYGFVTADSGGPVPAGPYGGLTATTNAASEKGVNWTIDLPMAP